MFHAVLLLLSFAAVEQPADEVCLAFTGDLMHHCAQVPAARRASVDRGYDYRGSFEFVTEILSGADLALGNLETPADGVHEDHCFPKFSARPEYLDALAAAGFDVLSVANNHALDRGSDGLARTVARIAERGLAPVGSTETRLASLTVKGVRVAVVAATEITNIPCEGVPCPILLGDGAALADAVRSAAATHDLVVVFLHWMREYQDHPDKPHRALARALADAGALAIVGAHPHVLADAEALDLPGQRAFVRYSLGNFLAAGKSFTTRVGGIDKVCFRRTPAAWTLARHEFIPTAIRKDAGRDRPDVYQPIPLAPALAQCTTGEGPFPRLRKWECADLRWLRDHLDRHPAWETLPRSAP